MTTEAKLEAYLESLDKALNQISVSDRADIITEIKSHVLEAQERDPNASLASILASLGEPETVANRYLLERGLSPMKPSKTPMVKWLTIGFLGTLSIGLIGVLSILWFIHPVVSVDEENERVRIMGGLIDVDGKAGKVKVGGNWIRHNFVGGVHELEGERVVDPKKMKEIEFSFANGKVDLHSTSSKELRWDCKHSGSEDDVDIDENTKKGRFRFNFRNTGWSKCDISIPYQLKLFVSGQNGKVELNKVQGDTTVNLQNGKVEIKPDPNREYKYDHTIQIGKIDHFESSNAKNAIRVKVNLQNGKIDRD